MDPGGWWGGVLCIMRATLAGNYDIVDGLGQSKAAVSTSEIGLRMVDVSKEWERKGGLSRDSHVDSLF